MDKKIEESKLFRKKMFLILGMVTLLILSLFFFRTPNVEPQINYSTIYIDEVEEQTSEETPAPTPVLVLPDQQAKSEAERYADEIIKLFRAGGLCDNFRNTIMQISQSTFPDNIKFIQMDKIIDTAYVANCIAN